MRQAVGDLLYREIAAMNLDPSWRWTLSHVTGEVTGVVTGEVTPQVPRKSLPCSVCSERFVARCPGGEIVQQQGLQNVRSL